MLSKTHRWSMFFISAVFFLYEFVLRVSPGAMAMELQQVLVSDVLF
jgi:calcineurin-like phosphoesterase family protein